MITRLSIATLVGALAATSIGCHVPFESKGLPTNYNLPPAQRIMEPGPGVGGPGPGVIPPDYGPGVGQQPTPQAQVLFSKPESMQVQWDVGGIGLYDSTPLIVPGRQNFPQGGIYRLKLTNVEGREGVELYPSMEIGPTTPRTAAFLAHNAIPIQFTEEDFDQVLSGNFVTKVVYLPDPEFQELALAGVETLVSTRLDPGIDPIVEGDRRGAILAIIRLGNKDEEMPQPEVDGAIAPIGYFLGAGPVHPVGFAPAPPGGAPGMPMSASPLPFSSGTMKPNYISGVTAPPWGMPMSGTPIGLPGPPHIPHGIPAGLRKHSIHNHTKQFIPDPVKHITVDVQQTPGMAYPAPANKVFIKEQTIHPRHMNRQPPSDMIRFQQNLPPGHGHH